MPGDGDGGGDHINGAWLADGACMCVYVCVLCFCFVCSGECSVCLFVILISIH